MGNDQNKVPHSKESQTGSRTGHISREKILVIDFGGQYNQLVAIRVRECNVYCEI